jgi:hypothetical protein
LKTKCSRRADATPARAASQRLTGVADGEVKFAADKVACFQAKFEIRDVSAKQKLMLF